MTWKELVALDLATEDEYWLNEVARDAVIREILPSLVHDKLVEILDTGVQVDPETAARLLADEQSWTGSTISFIATPIGKKRYMDLGSERLTALWRHAASEGYRNAGFTEGEGE